jgi:hypothetical protein
VSRAYISPEKPRLAVNVRVSPLFLPVFWNWENLDLSLILHTVVSDRADTTCSIAYVERAWLCHGR